VSKIVDVTEGSASPAGDSVETKNFTTPAASVKAFQASSALSNDDDDSIILGSLLIDSPEPSPAVAGDTIAAAGSSVCPLATVSFGGEEPNYAEMLYSKMLDQEKQGQDVTLRVEECSIIGLENRQEARQHHQELIPNHQELKQNQNNLLVLVENLQVSLDKLHEDYAKLMESNNKLQETNRLLEKRLDVKMIKATEAESRAKDLTIEKLYLQIGKDAKEIEALKESFRLYRHDSARVKRENTSLRQENDKLKKVLSSSK
jgi:regulator of replication initiation timing